MAKEHYINVSGSNVIIAPSASTAPQTIQHAVAQPPVFPDTPSFDVTPQPSAIIHHYVTHDAVGVPALIREARHHIVLHAAYYPKYGFDNQGTDISKAMEKTPDLCLTAIFTDVNALWVDEFAVTLRDYFAKECKFSQHLDITKQHFVRLRNKFGTQRVHIYDTARLPLFPVILIDDTIIVGHYAHSTVIPPNGLWFTIKHPKIPHMYESLLAGSTPDCNTPEESAILRYIEELIVNDETSPKT